MALCQSDSEQEKKSSRNEGNLTRVRRDDYSKRGSGMVQSYYIIFKGSELEKGGKN